MSAPAVQPAVYCLSCNHLAVLSPKGDRVVCARCQAVLVEKISGEDRLSDLE